MIRLLTNTFPPSVFPLGLRRCSSTGAEDSAKKIASIATTRLSPIKEFKQLMAIGIQEERDKNLHYALDSFEIARDLLPDTPANQKKRDAVNSCIKGVKAKMRFLDLIGNPTDQTPESRLARKVYDAVSSGTFPSRIEEIRLLLDECVKDKK